MMELLTAKDSLDFPYCRMCKIHVPKAVDLLGCHVCICKSCLESALNLFDNDRKTLEHLRCGKHLFKRYLFCNEYAEEMKCIYCDYVIWPCFSEEEARKAICDISGEYIECTKS